MFGERLRRATRVLKSESPKGDRIPLMGDSRVEGLRFSCLNMEVNLVLKSYRYSQQISGIKGLKVRGERENKFITSV